MGFVGNYAPCGLSPQTDGMPVIQKDTQACTWAPSFDVCIQLYVIRKEEKKCVRECWIHL